MNRRMMETRTKDKKDGKRWIDKRKNMEKKITEKCILYY